MNNLLIIGAGQHGRVVQEVAVRMKTFDRIDFLDDASSDAVGKISDLKKFASDYKNCFIAIGNNQIRSEIYEKARSLGYFFPAIIHPTAQISPTAKIGEGTVIMHNCVINSEAVIQSCSIIGIGSIIDHNSRIGHASHLKPGCIVDSNTEIPDFSLLPAGEIVRGTIK